METIVQRYWDGVAGRLQLEANVFNAIPTHPGEKGRANEQSLTALVRQLLPVTVGVGTGTIINPASDQSNQMDLVVFDIGSQPQLLAQTEQFLFPIETTLAVIEVKTRLTAREIADAGKKAARLREMTPEGADPVHFSLFAYNIGDAESTAVNTLNSMSPEERPDSVCVLRPAIFGGSPEEGNVGFVQLHERDEAGNRVPGSTVSPNGGSAVDYPEARLEPYATNKILTEPGRALLLYGQELMRALSVVGRVQHAWLSNYIPEPCAEVTMPTG